MENVYFYDTVIGRILIAEDGEGITQLSLVSGDVEEAVKTENDRFVITETELIKEAARQLGQYLEGERKSFDIRLKPKGTDFQRKVWDALQRIPYGETRSYKQIAEAVGNEKACRAVGMANHNNPIMCIIPCHRVIGADGKLVGYGGGLELKDKLLELEKVKERK